MESDGGFPVTGVDPVAVAGSLAGFDPSGLDGDSLLTVMAGVERIVAAAHAAQVKAMAEFTRLRPHTPGRQFGEFIADEIALELSITRRAAETRIAQAVELTTRLPAVLAALQTGAVDLYRARIITEATYRLDDTTATRVATHVVDRVEGRNASQVRRI
ncbi:MAG TPA: DUF222 domain-containing protein, partial [Mycobacteriales bacterium]|nr:DUF222 domain-containing protein [Mycobacteriales bacterium]